MKHLDGDKCFMELTKVDCALIVEYLNYSVEYCKEHDLRSPVKSINEYAKKFKSMYGIVSKEEMLQRR